jgi:quinoprotein glucose dehydrogenase
LLTEFLPNFVKVFAFFKALRALLSRAVREFHKTFFWSVFILLTTAILSHGQATNPQPRVATPAPVAAMPKTNELEVAIRKLRVPENFRVELFASEPLIQNPVSFAFDAKGRAYVVETHRRRTSVYDIRNHPDWLDDDLSFRTVTDRSNFFRRILVPENKNLPASIVVDRNGDGKFDWHDLEVESERLRLIEDFNGDGIADHATTFADDFKTLVSGVAAGVAVRKNDVYFACIPDLWLLRDINSDGVADMRQRLHTGFGVHISLGGHDLHGLKFGPDGKLYFSIGDRGLNVVTGNRTLANPDSGAILRCNPDGSQLELYATGLRNPQELAFDQYGNLFTGDNNGDGGDPARWLYVVEGGDYGWHIGWQHLPKMGPWNSEHLWDFAPVNTAAYLLPPVAHIGHGPAGVAFYPGTGLPISYQNHFFMCDFPGGVHSFMVRPNGAGFMVTDLKQILWELYPVDVDFAPNGGLYVLDWVEGWEKTGKGRIWRVTERASLQDPIVNATRQILGQGFDQRSDQELATLLGHADMRVRMEAQFTLASRGLLATNVLAQAMLPTFPELGRLHAMWALAQIGRANPDVLNLIVPHLLDYVSIEVRAQALKILGDARLGYASGEFARALRDPNPRIRYFAAMALAKLRLPEAVAAIQSFLAENNDADAYLRHAGVMAFTWLDDMNVLDTAARDNSPSVRLAACLAMRRLQRPEIAMFLYDSKPSIVTEAARAIYDVPIARAMSQLASQITKPALSEPATRRVLHANFRQGNLENAMALSEFANRTNVSAGLRAEAVELLGRWGEPIKRDLLVGLWRPLPPREARAASLTMRGEIGNLLQNAPIEVRIAAVQAAVRLGIDSISSELLAIVSNKTAPTELRIESLKALAAFKDPRLKDAIQVANADQNAALRKVAAPLEVKSAAPANAASAALKLLDTGSIPQKQSALEALGDLQGPSVDPILLMWLDRAISGKAPKEIQLEILEAAAKRKDPLVKSTFDRFMANRAKENPLGNYTECLAGGDADAGKKIFFERNDLGCLRCHKINGEGGEVGPDLTGIGSRVNREYLLESMVLPNAKITQGYENLVITMKDGKNHIGLLKGEDAQNVTISSQEDGVLKLPKADIQNLDLGLSAMPADLVRMMSKRDLRNLIEFMATRVQPQKTSAAVTK